MIIENLRILIAKMEKTSQKTGEPSAELRKETPFHKAAPGTQVRREAVNEHVD